MNCQGQEAKRDLPLQILCIVTCHTPPATCFPSPPPDVYIKCHSIVGMCPDIMFTRLISSADHKPLCVPWPSSDKKEKKNNLCSLTLSPGSRMLLCMAVYSLLLFFLNLHKKEHIGLKNVYAQWVRSNSLNFMLFLSVCECQDSLMPGLPWGLTVFLCN